MSSEPPKSKIAKQFSKWALLDLNFNKTYLLSIGENLIGRSNGNDITLDNNTICSRVHAFITINNEIIKYKDISRNGSLLKTTNEFNQIKKSTAPIFENSEIKIGPSKLKLINIKNIKSINITDENTETNINKESNIIMINDDEMPNKSNKNTNNSKINNDTEYINNNEKNKTENEQARIMKKLNNSKIIEDNKKQKISKTIKKNKNTERVKRINSMIEQMNNTIIELNNSKNNKKSNENKTNDNIENNLNKINTIQHTIENII